MKKILLTLILIICGLGRAQTAMTAAEARAFVGTVVKESQAIQTLETDFTQVKNDAMLAKPMVSTGKMQMQMPDKLSWKYLSPAPMSIISKDNKLYINNKGKSTTLDAKSKMFEKINKLMVGSASGRMFSDPDFAVQYYKSGSFNMARFTPANKQISKYLKQIDLYFPQGKSTVSQVKMTDASGILTTISFKNTKINQPLPASAFSN